MDNNAYTLNVFMHDRHIGILSQKNGKLSFQYTSSYLSDKNACPLSESLHLAAEKYTDPGVENYFSNLLPDERIRDIVAFILHTSRDNTFRLLKEIGADCAGAVAFYPPGQTPHSESDPVYRKLSDKEAYAILDNLGQRPLDVGDEGVRISGAGSQEKLVACVFDGQIALPLYGTPSTHIIKPPILNFPDSVFNELFCMKLASTCGLPAADCDILTIQGEPFYSVRRFDREDIKGHPRRLHQEDFCQLLNVPPHLKYEEDGGPGIADCMKKMTAMRLSAASKIQFLRLAIFNFLTGNCDAHAKNFAILYRNGIPELTPAYDLLSTTVYDNMSRKLAMSIGGEFRMGSIAMEHFEMLAEACEFKKQFVVSEVRRLAGMILPRAEKLSGELNSTYPDKVYGRIIFEIKKNLSQLS